MHQQNVLLSLIIKKSQRGQSPKETLKLKLKIYNVTYLKVDITSSFKGPNQIYACHKHFI